MNKLIRKAFTLIELLVVIAIVGILSGLIIVSMGGITNKARIAKVQIFSNSLRNSLMANIVGEWKFEGPTAIGQVATVNDIKDSWEASTGTIYGSPTVKGGNDCVLGKCLAFNGSTDYIDYASGSNLNFGIDNFTLAAWVNTSMAGSVPGSAILARTNLGGSYWAFFITRDSSYVEFFFYVSPEATARVQYFYNAYGKINDGKWHFVNLVENYGVNGMLYIDGNYFGTSTVVFTSLDSTNNVRIGSANFNGLLDDIRAYNAAMSTSQIKEQYYAGLNKLFANGGISNEEYISRINEVTNKTAEAK